MTGVHRVQRAMRNLRRQRPKQFSVGLKKAGQKVMRESQKIVPVKRGELKKSGFVRPEGQGIKFSVLVGYTQSYAIFVHENLEAYHRPPTTAKYLSRILQEKTKEILDIIRRETIS